MFGGQGLGNPFGGFAATGPSAGWAQQEEEDELSEEEEWTLERFIKGPISERIPSDSQLKKRIPIARLPRGHTKEIIKFAVDHEEKYVYFVTEDVRCIYRAAIAEGVDDCAVPPYAEVIYEAFGESEGRQRTNLFGGSFRAEQFSIWVEKSTNQLVVASRRFIGRLSTNFKRFDVIEWPQTTAINPGSLILASSGKIIGCSSTNIVELVLSGSQITFNDMAPLPPIRVHPFHFNQAQDGSVYLSTSNSILKFSPGATKWEAFAGQGQKVAEGAAQRLNGAPLTADIEHAPVLACDSLSNVIIFNDGSHRGPHHYDQLWHYVFSDGKRFETIGFSSHVYSNAQWISKWANYVHISPNQNHLFMSNTHMVFKVEYEPPQPAPDTNLSKLWDAHPELADFTTQCSFGQVFLHKCILSVRWPQALDTLQAEGQLPSIPPHLQRVVLRYVYDEYLPDSNDGFSPSNWVELATLAKSLKLEDLYARCKSGFQRSLWFAAPELSMLGVKAAADCDEFELLEIAKPLLPQRPEIIQDRGQMLCAHPFLMAALLNGLAAQATRTRGAFPDVSGPDFTLLEKPSMLGTNLLQLLEPGNGGMCDMSFQSIPCHQAIMFARFPFVQRALSSGFKESKEKKFTISDESKSPEALRSLLAFIYSNEASSRTIGPHEEICEQILDLIDFFQLNSYSDLIKHCKKFSPSKAQAAQDDAMQLDGGKDVSDTDFVNLLQCKL
eukprot:TRINITY_DN1387_c0_g1_i1.p1 TRINITY_DN1387_c0_g1~~TRINITY_DN1387_c0_g1_i1.p1  ORF type:complete len:724 (-),score=102.03 TRINITY_DN1387_c0_g1_i1:220-2391(-)